MGKRKWKLPRALDVTLQVLVVVAALLALRKGLIEYLRMLVKKGYI